jgi:hypothetical protein
MADGKVRHSYRVFERQAMNNLAGRVLDLDLLVKVDMPFERIGRDHRARFSKGGLGDACEGQAATVRIEQ